MKFTKIADAYKNGIIFNYYKNSKINEKLILLESKNGTDIAGNIFYLLKELSKKEYQNYKIAIPLKKELFEDKKKILDKYGIFNVEFIEVGSLNYYKYLYTAKYLFSDSTFPVNYAKKEEQVYVNTWHGTPLKKLGKSNIKRGYALGNVQRNFIMADFLIYPNPFMEKTMIDSFMFENLSTGKIINEGYPRNSVFFNENSSNKLKSQLKLENKEIIAYMPTWRGSYNNINIESQNNTLKKYFSEIDKLLSDNQIMYVKLHNIVENQINYDNYKHVKSFPKDIETYDFLNIANCLITDYSSVFFDFASSKKKIILFAYDEEEYCENNGTYFPLSELSFPKVYDVEKLVNEINNIKNYDDEDFLRKFCKYDRANSAKYICEYVILNKDNDIKVKNLKSNDKPNVLIYVGSLKNNNITKRLVNLLENIDLNKRNYYLTSNSHEIAKNPAILHELSKIIDYIPLKDRLTFNIKDLIVSKLFFRFGFYNKLIKKQLDSYFEKNICKYFPNNNFKYVIQFTGLNKLMINLFDRFKSKKTIFIQSNMLKKIKKDKSYELTLKNAYDDYDDVFLINENLLKSKLKISPKKSNLIISNEDDLEKFIEDFESIFK